MIIQLGEYQSGQLGRTVNPLTYVFTGSNPVSPTLRFCQKNNYFCNHVIKSGSSSVGRAAAFQAAGRGFEPRLPLYAFIGIHKCQQPT